VDRLGSTLATFMKREPVSPYRIGAAGRLRVVAPTVGFEEMIDGAYNQLRTYGATHVLVLTRILEVLTVLADEATTREQRAAVLRHGAMTLRAGREHLSEPNDRSELERRYEAVVRAVGEPHAVA